MLAVAPVEGSPRMTVRCGHLYIVPKSDRIIIGATTEPGRTIEQPDDRNHRGIASRGGRDLPRALGRSNRFGSLGLEFALGSKDHAPILGETRCPGLFVATGHYRNGILLAPITAQIMADLILEGQASDLATAFAPSARQTEHV